MTEREKQLLELVEAQAKKIDLLEEKIDMLTRRLYAKSSEQLDLNQLQLELNEIKKDVAARGKEEQHNLKLAAEQHTNKGKRNRPKLPENLPVETEVLIPLEVQANPEGYEKIGEKITERLNIEPAKLSIKRIVRPRYKCKNQNRLISTPLPPSLLEKSILSPSLLSFILCSKYCDHLPLHRQEQIFTRRYGLSICRSTMCEWVNLAAEYLEPIYKLIACQLRSCKHLQIDETPIRYLTSCGGKDGRVWVYSNQSVGVLYDWHNNRKNTCLDSILLDEHAPFTGIIQCDGYEAYNTWAKKYPEVELAGCWVHARRKFFEAKESGEEAVKALSYIAKLYALEKKYRAWLAENDHPPESVVYLRKRYSVPIYKDFGKYLRQLEKQLGRTKGHPLGKAIAYTLSQWQKLGRAISRSPYDLDNNHVERAIRPLKIGAKNWMFIGADKAGWRSTVIYTIIENVRMKGNDPYEYLKWLFERLPAMTNQDDLTQLMPNQWLEQQQRLLKISA